MAESGSATVPEPLNSARSAGSVSVTEAVVVCVRPWSIPPEVPEKSAVPS